MPPKTNPKPKTIEGWTVGDHIRELGGKLHLKDRNFKAYLESSWAEKHENEECIRRMRHQTKSKRIALAESENGDERVIKTVFQNNRDKRLSLQRYTAEQAIEIMDQNSCEAAKLLNALSHERAQRQKRVQDLKEELGSLEGLDDPSNEQLTDEQRKRTLENALDKARMKRQMAKNISIHYQEILKYLKEESKTLPARLDAMEEALQKQSTELTALIDMCKCAIVSRDESKKQLSIIEKETHESKRVRDAELTRTRKEVEQRLDNTEKVEKRRPVLISDAADIKALQILQEKRENQQKILSYEDTLQRIKDATSVTTVEDVVFRIKNQKETRQHLEQQKHEREALRNKQRAEKQKLDSDFHEMKYNGEQKLSKGQRLLDEMKDQITSETARHEKTQDRLERAGNTLVSLRTGITGLLEKLADVKLKAPNHNYPRDDVFDELDICRKKLEQLLKNVGMGKPSEDVLRQIQTSEFHDYLESQLPPENTRIKIKKSDTSMSVFDYNSQENEDALSRDDVKKLGQQLLDSKLKPKKKRSKKK